MKWKNVIVTGGAGFLGTHLVRALVNRAERVIVIDKDKPTASNKVTKVLYKKLDIRDDDIEIVFKKYKPDMVFHLAAHIDDRESVREPVMNAQHNLIGSLRVFEACEKYLQGKIIFASTGGVIYGNQREYPTSEQATPTPLTPYALSKLTAERYLFYYYQVYGLPFTALRFANIYGPGQDESAECGAIAIFTARLLRGEQAYINNDGKTTRDYIYVDDAIDAMLLAAEKEAVGVYNIGSGKEVATLDLFKEIASAIGVQAAPEFREEVQDLVKRSVLDSRKAKKELGWQPTVSLQEGLERTVQWYRDNV